MLQKVDVTNLFIEEEPMGYGITIRLLRSELKYLISTVR